MPQAGKVTAQDYGSAQWLLPVRLSGLGQLQIPLSFRLGFAQASGTCHATAFDQVQLRSWRT